MSVWTVETFSLRFRGGFFLIQKQNKFSLHHWQDFFSRSMATLRNRRKIAAVSRETPEGSRSSRAQKVLDLELTQGYISQVPEEIEGRVTKKLSKEFSKTESSILGALSKLDEFFLDPQVRTCSLGVAGTSWNTSSENRETTGDRSLDDPYPEVRYFSHHSGQINSPETETNPHISVDFQAFNEAFTGFSQQKRTVKIFSRLKSPGKRCDYESYHLMKQSFKSCCFPLMAFILWSTSLRNLMIIPTAYYFPPLYFKFEKEIYSMTNVDFSMHNLPIQKKWHALCVSWHWSVVFQSLKFGAL